MHDVTSLDCSRIAQDLQIRKVQVEAVAHLFAEGNTVPFITRYRKERTGGLDEEVIRQIQARLVFLKNLNERKQTILKSIEGQGKLNEDLKQAILKAETVKRLEDLYLPYKPKKRSLAAKAREQGLEPLALAMWYSDPALTNLDESLLAFVNPEKDLKTPEEARSSLQNLLAEMMAETALIRARVRCVLWETGKISASKSDKLPEGQGLEYKDYFTFSESVRQIPPHRILALNRGEKEHAIKVRIEWDTEAVKDTALKTLSEQLLMDAGHLPSPAAAPLSPEPQAAQEVIAPAESTTEMPAPLVAALEPPPIPVVLQGESLAGGEFKSPHASFLRSVLDDALNRLLLPSLEREIRRELTDEAEAHAVAVFARNLRSLLMQPPLRGKRVLGIDPGYRTGCKLAALDEYGNILEHAVIYPHMAQSKKGKDKPKEAPATPAGAEQTASSLNAANAAPSEPAAPPQQEASAPVPVNQTPPISVPGALQIVILSAFVPAPAPPPETNVAPSLQAQEAAARSLEKRQEAKGKLAELLDKHRIQIVALGNGSGCRETEELVADLISEGRSELAYVVVNEAGASVYSVSPVGREEFPEFDATLRSTISIGRRLQDPLSELVKVDPNNIGVGLYQHDMSRKELKESLESVVESCVNQVGVDVNTASVSLLRHVSGLNQLVARELVDYRKQHGPFTTREALLQVAGLGQARFVQAAGFLKIPGGANPLDYTWVHPESYPLAAQILGDLGLSAGSLSEKTTLSDLQAKLQALNPEEISKRLNAGLPTVADIMQALAKPGLDPRDELPPPIFKKGILKLEDLQSGMELKGTVLNVVDFGAFVDIGLKDSGLVHISQMANRYIKSPYDVVAVSDVVTVWVMNVDKERHRVSLTMIQPGTERKPGERGASRPPRQGRPPRARRPEETAAPGEGQDQSSGRGPRRRGPARRGPGGPPQVPSSPVGEPVPGSAGEFAATAAVSPAAVAPRPAPPPRKPRREPPRPKLSQAALEGKVPLRTFGELSALFAAKKEPEKKPASEENIS